MAKNTTVEHTVGETTSAQRRQSKKNRPDVLIHRTHKARAQWFRDNAAWPQREAPTDRLVRESRRARRTLTSLEFEEDWQLAGPTNVGGRTTSVVAHPDDADHVWAGSAGGGVWESKDAGRTWKALWKNQLSLNVGAMAIDPKDPDVLYAGTGEANLSADSYPGVGIYKSTNAGRTWRLVARSSSTGIPARIGVIAIDPFDSKHVMVGGVGHHYPSEQNVSGQGGIYRSKDGGLTWKRFDFISKKEYRCHAVVFDPEDRGTIYVTVTEQGAKNGIWRTTDGGANWTHLLKGLPAAEHTARTSLAIAPSAPRKLYALIAAEDSTVLGVFKTTNGGNSWKEITGNGFHYKRGGYSYEGQMMYGNCIAVSPKNSNHVICGGVDLHRTQDGGSTWELVSKWDRRRGQSDYAHADHHALLYPSDDPDRIYDMNDGGMDVSYDGGDTWRNRSDGLACTMYYDLDVAQSNASCFGGGAQDNGTLITETGGANDHFDVTGGDGGWIVYDPNDENHLFTSVYNMNIFRWPSNTGSWLNVTPNAPASEKGSVWMVYIAMHPTDPKTVYTGSSRVWKSTNDGVSWKPVSTHFPGTISAIDVNKKDPDRVYVGTTYGTIHRSKDGGATWSGNLAGADLPGYKITRIASRSDDADSVVATLANFGVSHVFRSDDGCESWEDVDRGRLPDVPHHTIAIPTNFPDEIYVGTDVGVFVSEDFGDSWLNITGGLPNVSIVDLVYHDKADQLTAATYGRSHWRLQVRV